MKKNNQLILLIISILALGTLFTACEMPGDSDVYSVTYDGNGGTGGTVPVDAGEYTPGSTVIVQGNTGTLVKTGYDFAGWNSVADGSGTSYNTGDAFVIGNADVVLYAQWTGLYTVTYDGNGNTGGSVPEDTSEYTPGSTITVQGNTGTLVKTGYEFAGWNTSSDGSGTSYDTGDIFVIGSADVVLYAQWTGLYTVIYDGNGNTSGSVPKDPAWYNSGTEVMVLGSGGDLLRSGYEFGGWNTVADGSGTTYTTKDTFEMGTAHVVLYALWVPVYSVTYYGNGSTGGTVPIDELWHHDGTTVPVLEDTGSLVRDGYLFIGWNTASDGSGTFYYPGDTITINSSDIYLYADWLVFDAETIIQGSDGEAADCFGNSVSVSGDWVIVGAEEEDTMGTGAGAVYIFERTGSSSWSQAEILHASDGEEEDYFGFSVAISGNYAIVGAYQEDTQATDAGAAYIFEKDSSDNWSQTGILYASDPEESDHFGYSVAISGNYALVAAEREDTGGIDAGAVYVFKNDGSGSWSQETILYASDQARGDYFGHSVALSGDYAVIGAYLEDGTASNMGAAYIFERDGSGNWSEAEILHPSDAENDDQFGCSVAISGDTAVIGAYRESSGGTWAGAAYVFERDSFGSWNEAEILHASDAASLDYFGYSAGVSGECIVVGAYMKDTEASDAGAAYIYKRDGAGNWNEATILYASDAATKDYFGRSVGISDEYAVIGAYMDNGGSDAGAVHIYE